MIDNSRQMEGKIMIDKTSNVEELRNQKPNSLREAMRNFKREYIRTTIEHAGGVQKRAARILGIQPSYLSRLLKQLKSDPN